jgi:hypothetical protein
VTTPESAEDSLDDIKRFALMLAGADWTQAKGTDEMKAVLRAALDDWGKATWDQIEAFVFQPSDDDRPVI